MSEDSWSKDMTKSLNKTKDSIKLFSSVIDICIDALKTIESHGKVAGVDTSEIACTALQKVKDLL